VKKVRILILEDDEWLKETLVHVLTFHNFEVCAKSTVKEALEVLGSEKIDLIVSDFIIPRKGRLGLLELSKGSLGIPLIVFSGHDECDIKNALIHVDCFVKKPCATVELLAVINSVLQQSQDSKNNLES
jgi:DNA-binding response OmpR family regulator